MDAKTCDGCEWVEQAPFGVSWFCKRHAPGPEGFPKAGLRCGDYSFDVEAERAKTDAAVEAAWNAARRERLLRWIAAGRPSADQWIVPVVTDEDERHGGV